MEHEINVINFYETNVAHLRYSNQGMCPAATRPPCATHSMLQLWTQPCVHLNNQAFYQEDTQNTALGVMGNCACNCNVVYNKRSTKYPCVSGSCLTDTTLKIHTNSVTDNVNCYY